MHAAALFAALGEAKAREFFEGFLENGGTIVSSNGEVRRRVASGDFAVGLTDTDRGLSKADARKTALDSLTLCGVAELIDRKPGEISGGRTTAVGYGSRTGRAAEVPAP